VQGQAKIHFTQKENGHGKLFPTAPQAKMDFNE